MHVNALLVFVAVSLSISIVHGEPTQLLHQAEVPVHALAAGETDPTHDGPEVVCLLENGNVVQLSTDNETWNVETIHIGSKPTSGIHQRPTIEVGDVHSGWPGNEIVVHNGRDVILLYKDQLADWQSEYVFDASGTVGSGWGARIGDYDPQHPGMEILHIYEGVLDLSSAVVFREVENAWEGEIIYYGEVVMDSAVGDFNQEHPGLEIVLPTEVGKTYEVVYPDSETSRVACPGGTCWPRRIIWDNTPNSGWVVKPADVFGGPNDELIYGTRYSNRILMSRDEGAENPHLLFALFIGFASTTNPAQNMWDIAVGDMMPEWNREEIAGVDNSGYVYVVSNRLTRWWGDVLWKDTSPLYAVVAADFLPDQSGDELIVAGKSGSVTMVSTQRTSNWFIK